ncbi:MAG TPA: PDZ domain-containing protein [Pyrinomonadaceae bacterium]|nr:PDZ domain-containing protein [Pyrinomonadaceae bacterium]
MKRTVLGFLILLTASIVVFAQSETPMLFRQPTMNKTDIVFVFAGDLWRVSRSGGAAERLTSGTGNETNPIFSPDGNWIAFTGEYDGNVDAYVIPSTGGEPRRITYHAGNDGVIGWTPDGNSVVFLSGRSAGMPAAKMYTMPVSGAGLPNELPFPMAGGGASFSPDGGRIAYMPLSPAFQQWKKYRGGRTTKIWIGNLSDSSVEEIPRQNSNDYAPLWIGDKIYFLSDRNGRNVTLYSYDTNTKKVAQAINNDGLDLKTISAGPDGIVYEQFGSINIFNPSSGKASKVNITLNGDLPQVRPRYEKVAQRVQNVAISAAGARAVFEARGEILSVPAEKGNARNLTNTPGIMERDPAWSPDGKWIAYFSDESGEYALHLRDQTGMGEVKKISLGNPSSYFYTPKFSPDSKKILFTDKRLNIWYLDLDKGTSVKVDTNTFENPFPVLDPNWSPDSKWIVYTKQLRNRLCAVHVFSLDSGKTTQVTDGMSDARYAAFDKNGKYVYFTASTNNGPTTGWLDMSSFPFQTTSSVYAVVLKNTDPSPLAPESDEEKPQDEAPKPPRAPGAKPEPVVVTIDLDKIGQRIVALPLPARNYQGLVTGKAGTFFLVEAVPPSGTGTTPQIGATIHRFEMDKRKAEKILDGVTQFDVSANGEKMLFGQFPGRFTIASTVTPLKPGEGVLNVGDMEVYVDPRAEWQQMYREAWRVQRDFFYDPNFHGLNIKAAEEKYRPFLNGIASRADLNYLFQEMLGNLVVGHHNSGGGDSPQPTRYTGGLLGADYRIENGRYRFAKIYDGENWNPGLFAPLTQPGVNVKEGEYLIAVNGREVRATDNIYSFFQQTAGKQIVIKVGASADGKDARQVTVVPVANEGGLRNLAWIEGNRRKVSELSGGKLAYVYLPNTGGAGYTNFNRYYFAQIDREGAVIDERFNGGGSAADYMIAYMSRPLMNYWSTREGEDFTTPVAAIYGPKTMIINEYSSSGGDLLPFLFRQNKLGALVGKRTWGGLVGIYNYPVLMDGGQVTAPRVAFRNAQGELDVENKGVAPDIEVDLDPKIWRQGRDIQLEKAVEVTLAEIKRNPVRKPAKGAFPNYQKAR